MRSIWRNMRRGLKKWNGELSDIARDDLKNMKKQCLEALRIVNRQEEDVPAVILNQAALMEQKIDDTREKYFKKQMPTS